MRRYRTILTVSLLACCLVGALPAPAVAQYSVICYESPAITYATPPAAPPYFVGASYSLYTPSYSTSRYYAPGYSVPTYYTPRYYNPGPYYYTPAYSYTPGYYSYYYTPGYFRY